MPSLIFESRTKTQIDALAAQLPQSLLVVGQSGVGLRTAATYLAGRRLAAIISPRDKDNIETPTGSIKLEAIAQLRKQTRGRTNRQTIYIIDDADHMNHRAQNAFLKLLEEPAPNVHFILTSHRPHLLLPTILSRVERLNIRPLPKSQSELFMKNLKIKDARTRQQLTFLAEGRPAEIFRLANQPAQLEKIGATMRDAERFIHAATYERLTIAAKYTERGGAQQFLACCLSILRHSIARDFSSRKTIDHAQRVVQAYERIAANGNVRLQLTELSL